MKATFLNILYTQLEGSSYSDKPVDKIEAVKNAVRLTNNATNKTMTDKQVNKYLDAYNSNYKNPCEHLTWGGYKA